MAGSIKLFRLYQKTHQTFGIYPAEWNQKYLSTKSINAIFVICFIPYTFLSAAYFVIEAKSMFEFGTTFCILMCALNVIAVYLIFVWQSENALKFIESCENLIAKRFHSADAYNDTIGKIELFYKFFGSGVISTMITLFFSTALYSYAQYFVFDKGADSFFLFPPAWYPFDWRTPSGYLVAWLAQFIWLILVNCIDVQFLSLLFISCWLFVFIAKDITQDVAEFNFIATTTTDENRTELTKRFCDLVQIYTDAKECVMGFNETIKYSLFSFFAWDLFFLAAILVTTQFELWADGTNEFAMVTLIICLVWTIAFLFMICEPGAMVTEKFGGFGDELSQLEWYTLPPKMQRMYVLFLSDTQNPVNLSSYAGITCERDTSKKILNTAYSYFSTFRNFGP